MYLALYMVNYTQDNGRWCSRDMSCYMQLRTSIAHLTSLKFNILMIEIKGKFIVNCSRGCKIQNAFCLGERYWIRLFYSLCFPAVDLLTLLYSLISTDMTCAQRRSFLQYRVVLKSCFKLPRKRSSRCDNRCPSRLPEPFRPCPQRGWSPYRRLHILVRTSYKSEKNIVIQKQWRVNLRLANA